MYKGVFMKIYLIDRKTNETKNAYDNVISWRENYVEYLNGGYRGKLYCNTKTEYFSDEEATDINTDTN